VRVCSFRRDNDVRVGVIVEDHVVDAVEAARAVGARADLLADLRSAIEAGAEGEAALRAAVGGAQLVGPEHKVALADADLVAPYRPLQNFFVADGNARLAGGKPKETIPAFAYYGRAASSVSDPGAAITWPEYLSDEVVVEPQLAIVIGRPLQYASEDEALAAIFGYAVLNAANAWNLRAKHAQLMKSGSLDSFSPWGPWITTADAVADPDSLRVELEINGEVVSTGSTGDAAADVASLLREITTGITLRAGDVVILGSTQLVGPDGPVGGYRVSGDSVVGRIEGVGELSNSIGDRY